MVTNGSRTYSREEIDKRLAQLPRVELAVLPTPGVPPQGELKDFSLLDVAPTVLHLMGLPVPQDMEGRVLIEGKTE